MYLDWTYIVIVLPFVLLSMLASANVQSTYRRYANQYSRLGITAEQAVQTVLRANGLYGVRIGRVSGELTDHYDPRTNTIHLSDSVYGQTSTAAIGVACHEAGHAIQHEVGYAPIRVRTAIIPITNIGAKLSIPLILLGAVIGTSFGAQLIYIGIACFGLSTVFQLVTLPTEFDASRRALRAITESRILDESELKGARRTLRAAALTYVAALAVSLAQLLRLLVMFGGLSDRRRR